MPAQAASLLRRTDSIAVLVYLFLCLVDLASILTLTHGHLVFTLDDPMIHLALARQIAHGHYGINPGEFTSPSSSVLWPFLMALFGRTPWLAGWALVVNLAAGILCSWVLGRSVEEFAPSLSPRGRILVALLLLFVANLAGLTFIGMEHTLQVALCALCGYAILRALNDRPIPAACWLAAALAPSIRYEALGITLAVAIALWARRQRASALTLFAVALLPLIAFGLYLRHLGLPPLPLSVLTKGGVATQHTSAAHAIVALLRTALTLTAHDPDRLFLVFLLAALLVASSLERRHAPRIILLGVALAAFLHLLIGRFGWFHRYEIYIVTFAAMVLLGWFVARFHGRHVAWVALALALIALRSFHAAAVTPGYAHAMYLQQFQMGRFVQTFYSGDVAVNDLGWVAYDKQPQQYVFDLLGLASAEAAQQPDKSPAWQDEMAAEHHLGLVLRYADIQDLGPAPRDWTELAELSSHPLLSNARSDCVLFYATPQGDPAALRSDLARFATTLPPGAFLTPPGQCADRQREHVLRRLLGH